jgi:hypothetical protein
VGHLFRKERQRAGDHREDQQQQYRPRPVACEFEKEGDGDSDRGAQQGREHFTQPVARYGHLSTRLVRKIKYGLNSQMLRNPLDIKTSLLL